MSKMLSNAEHRNLPSGREVIERLKEATGCELDRDLAKRLEKDQSTISSWDTRDTIPFKSCIQVSLETGVSLDELVLGKKPLTVAPVDEDGAGVGKPRRFLDNMAMVSFGLQFMELRGERTQEEMAALVGVSRAAWSNYEAGRRLPSADIMKRVAEVSGVPHLKIDVMMKGMFGGFPLPSSPVNDDGSRVAKIDIDLFERCWEAAQLLAASTPVARILAVRTYNALQSGLGVIEGMTIHEVAALLLAAD